MEGMLTSRSYALNGVLNGVDLVEWDPDNDPHIYQTFGSTDFAEGKKVNKAGLQKEMGLPERPEVHTSARIGIVVLVWSYVMQYGQCWLHLPVK